MTESQKNRVWMRVDAFMLALVSFLIGLIFIGCSVPSQTVISKPIVSTEASFDGNQNDSGLKEFDGQGFIVSQHWMNRNDSMLAKFGERFLPPVKSGDRRGVEKVGSDYRVTAEVLVRFTRMNFWRKAEAGP